MSPALLADVVVVLHLAYVAFVVLLVPLVLIGRWAGWTWVRNPWLRIVHLLMMAVVATEAVCGVECPLTTWEHELKEEAGIFHDEDRSFVGRWANEILFVDVGEGAMTVIYLLFTLLIVATLVLVPPRRPGAAG
ncbi:MAG: DUF2784 domain-containing protein [Planctomycetota bacterium JB042]